jgi:hypothetical protein
MDFTAALNPNHPTDTQDTQTSNPYDLSPVRTGLARFEVKIQQMLAEAKAHLITDDRSYKAAVELGSGAKKLHRALETQRKGLVEQPNAFVKSVNGLCNVYKSSLAEIERTLKMAISAHAVIVEAGRRETERKAQEAARKLQQHLNQQTRQSGEVIPAMALPVLPPPQKTTRTETGAAAYTKKVWAFEIIDASQIPREYLIPNEKLIRERVMQGLRNIPGVRIFQNIQTNFRSS